MSEEGVEDTVTVKKSELSELLTEIKKLSSEITDIKNANEQLKQDLAEATKPVPVSTPRQPPIFHSQSIVEAQANRAMREAERDAKVQHDLSKATEYVIADYKQNPPKNRR